MYRIATTALLLKHLLFLSRKAGGKYITDGSRLLRYESMQQIIRCENCDV